MLIHLFLLFSLVNAQQKETYVSYMPDQYYGLFGPSGNSGLKRFDDDLFSNYSSDVRRFKKKVTASTSTPSKEDEPTGTGCDANCLNVYKSIGLKDNGVSSVRDAYDGNEIPIEKAEKELLDEKGHIKGDYMASVFSCTITSLNSCGEKDFLKATKTMDYYARVKIGVQLNKAYYAKIKEVAKNAINYGVNKGLKLNSDGNKMANELISARADLAKAESELLDYKNRVNMSKFGDIGIGKIPEKDPIISRLRTAKDTFESKIRKLNKEKFAKDTEKDKTTDADEIRETVRQALKTAEDDLRTQPDDINANDIYTSLPSGLDMCKDYAKKNDEDRKKCENLAAKYGAALASGGSTWSPVTIYNNKNCGFMDNLGATPFNSIMDIIGASKSVNLENCMMANGARGCTSEIASVRNFYNDPMNLTSQFYQDGKGNVGMNIATVDTKINTSLTSQTTPSMSIGGNIPSNIFSAYNPASGTGPTSPSGAGLGGGTGDRVNANTGAAILNNIAGQTSATGTGASNFNSQYSGSVNNITNFNNNLSGALTSWVDPNIYLKSASSVQKDLDNAKGGGARYPGNTGYDNTIDLRQKITELNAQKATLFQQLVDQVAKGNTDAYYIKYGSLSEQQQAAAHMALAAGYTDYVKMQMGVLDSQIQLYYTNTNRIIYNTAENTFDVSTMYASNGDAVYGKRSLTLKPLKTPVTNVTYVLKKGWQDEFKKYIATMLKKAEESKKQMNAAKAKMQQLLAKKVPLINLEKLPDTASVSNEIRNMESLEAVAKKNMIAIEAAMEYHRNKKLDTPADVYAQYEQEAATLKKSMQNVVSSIDQAKPELNRSYALLSKMDVEVPKSEALKRIAKQMVDQGM